jgi:hypothetical protein
VTFTYVFGFNFRNNEDICRVAIPGQLTHDPVDCIKVTDIKYIESFLKDRGRNLSEFDEQLATNHAFIFRMSSGEVVLAPGTLSADQSYLIFTNEQCFDDAISQDYFPVENYDKSIEEYDVEGMKNISSRIENYVDLLVRKYSIKNSSITRDTIQEMYSKVLNNKSRPPEEIVALGAVMGEALRIELKGSWILVKTYGTYNPYYSPRVLFDDDKIASIYDVLYSMLDSRIKESKKFFIRTGYQSRDVMTRAGVVFIQPQFSQQNDSFQRPLQLKRCFIAISVSFIYSVLKLFAGFASAVLTA